MQANTKPYIITFPDFLQAWPLEHRISPAYVLVEKGNKRWAQGLVELSIYILIVVYELIEIIPAYLLGKSAAISLTTSYLKNILSLGEDILSNYSL